MHTNQCALIVKLFQQYSETGIYPHGMERCQPQQSIHRRTQTHRYRRKESNGNQFTDDDLKRAKSENGTRCTIRRTWN